MARENTRERKDSKRERKGGESQFQICLASEIQFGYCKQNDLQPWPSGRFVWLIYARPSAGTTRSLFLSLRARYYRHNSRHFDTGLIKISISPIASWLLLPARNRGSCSCLSLCLLLKDRGGGIEATLTEHVDDQMLKWSTGARQRDSISRDKWSSWTHWLDILLISWPRICTWWEGKEVQSIWEE